MDGTTTSIFNRIGFDVCFGGSPERANHVEVDNGRFEIYFGGSPGRERHFEVEHAWFRMLFWRKSWAGAPCRSRNRKVSNSVLEEVLCGSAISKSKPKDFEFCFGGSLGRERHFEIEPTRVRFLFWRQSYAGAPFRIQTEKRVDLVFEEVLGGSAISKSNQNGFEI